MNRAHSATILASRAVSVVSVVIVVTVIACSVAAQAQPVTPGTSAVTSPSTPPSISDSPPATPVVPMPTSIKVEMSGGGSSSASKNAVITGAVGGISAILGVALTQFGAFMISRRQRRGDRMVAQLDELKTRTNELDSAYAEAKNSEFATTESHALDVAIRRYERAWRMVGDARIHSLAPAYHEKLKSFTVEGDDLEVENPTTRIDVDTASSALVDRIRAILNEID